jgi:HD superfamily phosphohydrolase YqeK
MDLDYYADILKGRLKPHRFHHSLRVLDTAIKMGNSFGLDGEKLRLAALLHDYAKDIPKSERS